jgi:cyclophilin family peptidyl-prolyl cis-trans isomerase
MLRILLSICLVFSLTSWVSAETTADADSKPKVLIETSLGNIELELNAQLAPKTVENFLAYVDDGFYNGTIFHRVINGFMIQGGGFDEQFKKKTTGANIQNEADNGLKNVRGTVAMARKSDPHSANAQFFINHVDNDYLDFKSRSTNGWGYCVFGKVTKGMETVDAIADVFTTTKNFMKNVPEKNVTILKVSRL